jgi:hypothetical protein
LDSTERVFVPLLIVQTISVIFLWSLDTLPLVSQKIFILFLASDLLSFALITHVYMSKKTDTTVRGVTLMAWGLAIMVLFIAGFLVS